MGAALAGIACALLVGLPIGLLIGAVILRGGVSFANKCLPTESDRDRDDWDDDEDEEYDRPRRRRAKPPIPEPGVGKAMGIVFVNFIANLVVTLPINIVMGVGLGNMNGGQQDPALSLLVTLVQLPISFLIGAGVRAGMLPTSFARACLVVVFEYLIVLAICLAIGVPLAIIAFAAGGR